MEKQYRVGFLGPAGTFSHEAAYKQFGPEANYLPMRSIPEVFFATARQEVDYGIVPVENAIEGAVTYTLDMFARPDPELAGLSICAEVYLPIVEHLLVAPAGPANLEDIALVYSHPQALAQCRNWLGQNLSWADLVETSSTTKAAELAAENPRAAAIANRLAAEKYGLQFLAKEIQDADFNQTRFLVISPNQPDLTAPPPAEADQYTTALMISIKDRVGALHAVTSIFVKYGLNMNRIESRPSKQKAWDYLFFIDFLGHASQPHVAAALRELNTETDWAKLLGSWPRQLEG